MNRSWIGLLGAVLVGTALVAGLRAQERQALRALRQAAEGPGRVVFTFADDAQLRAFAQLWNQRERALARLGTLQEYWAQEQRDLAQLSQRLADYHVDTTKSYVLDPDRKVLLEREPALPPPDSRSSPAPTVGPD